MESITVRVLTYNVEHVAGDTGRQKRMREGIAALNPDLVALQEVVRRPSYDQLSYLLGETGLYCIHQQDIQASSSVPDRDPDRMQLGIGTRWRPRDTCAAVVPGFGCFNGVIGAVIPLPIGADLLFMVPNPWWALDGESTRCIQAEAYSRFEEQYRCESPTIMAGDFDAVPESDSMRFYTGTHSLSGRSVYFRDAWIAAGNREPGYTWTTDNPGLEQFVASGLIDSRHHRRLDYILLGSSRPGASVIARVQECRVVLDDPPASDHYGVLATITFTRAGTV